MYRLGRRDEPAGHLADLPHHLEVLGLRGADDVQHQVGTEPLDAVDHARQIAGRVVEAAGAGLDDQRQRVTIAVVEAGREHDLGPVVLHQQTSVVEPLATVASISG